MIKKYFYATKVFVLITISVNLITLQKLIIKINKRKNKRGVFFKIAYYISVLSNLCLGLCLKDSQEYVAKKYQNIKP